MTKLITWLKGLFDKPSPTLRTHTAVAQINLNNEGDWVLFFTDARGKTLLEFDGHERNREVARAKAIKVRKRHQDKFKLKRVSI